MIYNVLICFKIKTIEPIFNEKHSEKWLFLLMKGLCGEASEYIGEYRYIEQSLGTILIQNSQDYIYVTFTLNSELNYRIQKLYLHLSRNDHQADNFDSTAPVYMANITDKSGVQSFTFKVDRVYLNFPVVGTEDTYNDGHPFYFASHGIVKTGECNEPWYKSVQYTVTNCE